MDKLKAVKDYFMNYCVENNVSDNDIEQLLDVLYSEAIQYFSNYEMFYSYFMDEF